MKQFFFALKIVSVCVYCHLCIKTSIHAQKTPLGILPFSSSNKAFNINEIRRTYEVWKSSEKIEEKQEIRKKTGFLRGEAEYKETFRFDRWLYWTERHLLSDGSLPPMDQNLNAWLRYQQIYRNSMEKRSAGANWINLGPNGIAPAKNESFPFPVHQGAGRVNCIAFHPKDSLIMYLGTASGGIFKTIDGGTSWFAIGENILTNRISDISIQSTSPNVLYACTGDIDASGYLSEWTERPMSHGVGILKSIDGGITWKPTGLFQEGFDSQRSLSMYFRRLYISPKNPNELLAVGIPGIFKSFNGGTTWSKVWDGNEAFCEVSQNPLNYRTLYAVNYNGFGQFKDLGDAGVWKSVDFGNTWIKQSTDPIPPRDSICRLAVAVSPADTNRVYVLGSDIAHLGFEALWRSDNGGTTWEVISSLLGGAPDILGYYPWQDYGSFGGQGFYNIVLQCDPKDRDKIYVGGVDVYMSQDGGETFNFVTWSADPKKSAMHVDQHYFAFSPHTGDAYACHDGGISRIKKIIPASASTLYSLECINVDATDLDSLFNPCFDLPTEHEYLPVGLVNTEFYRLGVDPHTPGQVAGGTQDNNGFFRNKKGKWSTIGDGDGFECIFHPGEPGTMFYSTYNGTLFRSPDLGTTMQSITDSILAAGAQGAWITPYQIIDSYPYTLYAGMDEVWKTNDDGLNWTKISDFGTLLNDTTRIPAIALKVAPSDTNTIFVFKPSSSDSLKRGGFLLKTTDGGISWEDITTKLPALNSTSALVTMIEIKHDNPNTIWLTLSGYADGEKVYQSSNGGATWTNISGSLPNVPAYCIIHHKNSASDGLYLGNEIGVFYRDKNMDDWEPYQTGMPHTTVMDLDIQYDEQKLYAATYGRGIWSSPTKQLSVGTRNLIRSEAFELILAPNPTESEVFVSAANLSNGKALVQVFDVLGRVFAVQQVLAVEKELSVRLDLSQLSAGVYFVQVRDAAGNALVRQVLKR